MYSTNSKLSETWLPHLSCVFATLGTLFLLYICYLTFSDGKYGDLFTGFSIFAAIAGWQVNAQKERESTLFNKRIEYLSEAYAAIALFVDRKPEPIERDYFLEYNKHLEGIEKATAMIQLYGEPEEIKSICEKIKGFKNSDDPKIKKIEFNDLLSSLRNSLRKALSLPHVCEPVISLRLKRNAPKNSPL